MIAVDCKDANWLSVTLEALGHTGAAIVRNVLPPAFLETTRERMYQVQAAYRRDIGDDRLARAGELGVLRLMLKYDPHFFRFLEVPEVVAVVWHVGKNPVYHSPLRSFLLINCLLIRLSGIGIGLWYRRLRGCQPI